ncbi:MAG: hypothetical protein ISS79_05735, partial [Phycisphaerae bacterium]|nr:hypothetical protein [Phycisphaerae bacterium]
YKYDDRVFFDYLTDKGFYIAEKSRSNYSTTFTSLASSLNMEYVNHMAEALGPNSKSRTPFYEAIENNKVARLLKAVGYKFMHFSSGWGATDRNEYADFDFHPSVADNEFQMVLLRATPLAYFRKNVGVMQARRRILYTFEKLAEACEISGPKFIFAHILCPHPPYLFDADGGIPEWTRLEMDGRAWSKKDLYLDQLVFTQKKTQELIDAILSNSRIAPIIILQADHGTSSIGRPHPPLEDTQEVTDMVSERLRIFNAYYLPGIESGSLYDSITPINTFRIIFNLYFNQDYELLEDRSYYSDYVNPNVLTDVTDRIRDQGEDANPGQLDGDQEGQNGP